MNIPQAGLYSPSALTLMAPNLDLVVARGGIEPPTRGFSAGPRRFQGLINQSLAALASPVPRPTQAQLRHTQSELGNVHPRTGEDRPFVVPEKSDHPLSLDFYGGITVARAQEIAEVIIHR
ncbi:MAG TPA: hypothetical protein VGG63_11030 [Steroidobacteraceae bacterium]